MIDVTDDVVEFYGRHCAIEGGVVIVHCKNAVIGVFSDLEMAVEWVDANIDEEGVIFVPYIIDEPEYDTVPAKEMH